MLIYLICFICPVGIYQVGWAAKQPSSPLCNLLVLVMQIDLVESKETITKITPPLRTIENVTVHINGARDPVATGRAVAHAIQRARANALHGGTE
ncbi:Uncharacterised protein [Candidatus Bartonella washoeensis]|uniref:Uncharacterized protein n=1 Tax=Candidatus Bartonella washoeensis Sb944nv TaxID=1094563 RepID=J1JAQ9_9HYPH|nr:hypothetical protein [Bartonella washoeensis]EJF81437.1 hypothetical protein MCQ_00135 [Bartonella washoeensis Sb944nv]SPU26515.1 Uncharacterised protein [Bartonella washoeensis]